MKMQSLYEEYKQEFMKSDQEYCCYCGDMRTSIGCCGENHFVTFADMDDDIQRDIINWEIECAFREDGLKQSEINEMLKEIQ